MDQIEERIIVSDRAHLGEFFIKYFLCGSVSHSPDTILMIKSFDLTELHFICWYAFELPNSSNILVVTYQSFRQPRQIWYWLTEAKISPSISMNSSKSRIRSSQRSVHFLEIGNGYVSQKMFPNLSCYFTKNVCYLIKSQTGIYYTQVWVFLLYLHLLIFCQYFPESRIPEICTKELKAIYQ